ncbi:unnamed protein product [Staurois parvus]|uniref:G-protein coupled receptors family 1 profile domain-containing protein n=1 Tax=Staurois parvus TaxID=386267 RepID=A0ABN9EIX2_9NEOB|nr:unnamed protein product [Staurois parvus]
MDECQNNTIRGFHIMGFTTSGTGTYLKFAGFLLMYVIAVTGNLLIALLVCKTPQLHTPMYFFLLNLSIVDATYVSAILPKLLSLTLTDYREISFEGCITQLYFFVFCADAEICILLCMAYDRYVAICSPLHYSMIMRKKCMCCDVWLLTCCQCLEFITLNFTYIYTILLLLSQYQPFLL